MQDLFDTEGGEFQGHAAWVVVADTSVAFKRFLDKCVNMQGIEEYG